MEKGIFELNAKYAPAGDQGKAIDTLCNSLEAGNKYATLLGVTGSGKTFTMASIIAKSNRPAIIISHNKTLAAQLYSEFKEFFPNNAVEYFVSYYDYYQPEAYIPQTDTYIEKDSAINDEIEKLRISTASSLVSRRDVIVIASVSCIYGLGSPEDFKKMMIPLRKGLKLNRNQLLETLVSINYLRNDVVMEQGYFRVRGDVVDIFPAYLDSVLRVEFFGSEIDSLKVIDAVTHTTKKKLDAFDLYPATAFVTPMENIERAIPKIRQEMEEQVAFFEKENKLIEAQRIRIRTEQDLDILRETGVCSGIENYSMHLGNRQKGSRPWCLIDFMPEDSILFLDESHVTVSQIRGSYNSDKARKERLVEFGFRLPSALDNRPLKYDEFSELTGQTIFVSATPKEYEIEQSKVIAEQVVRPTGLLDPEMIIRPIKNQVEDCSEMIREYAQRKERVFVTTLTKRMSEDISEYLRQIGIRVEYLHSDIDTLERVEILRKLRLGEFDALVGVNLLREGLDIPEVSLVCILDADKEGFLRSATSLIQTAGRAARHKDGKVILYADTITKSLRTALDVCGRRRTIQKEHNEKFGITPQSTVRKIEGSLAPKNDKKKNSKLDDMHLNERETLIEELKRDMLEAAKELKFEKAALIRDQIAMIKKSALKKS